MRLRLYHVALFLSLFTLAGCAEVVNNVTAPTPTPQPTTATNVYVSEDPQSTPVQNVVYALNGASGKLLWHYDSSEGEGYLPMIDHDVLYLTSSTSVIALNTQNGKQLWNYAEPGNPSILGILNGIIYVGDFYPGQDVGPGASASPPGLIYGLNASDGSVRWSYKATDRLLSGKLLGNVIYVTAIQGDCTCSAPPASTFALNTTDGSVLWKIDTHTAEFGPDLAANGLIYGAESIPEGPAGWLQTYHASNGSAGWRFPATEATALNIVGIDSNAIYLDSNDGDFINNPDVFYALNLTTGAVLWRSEVKGMTQANISLLDSVIYIGSSDGSVVALNATDGKQAWRAQLGQSGPPIATATFVAAAVGGSVYLVYPQGFAALKVSDGSIEWHYTAVGIMRIATVVNGVVYASSNDVDTVHTGHNKIYALNATDGSLNWRYNAPTMFFAPVVG